MPPQDTFSPQVAAFVWEGEVSTGGTVTAMGSTATFPLPAQGIEWVSSELWFEPVRDAVADLLTLADDWDSYGAPPVKSEYAAATVTLLHTIMDERTPTPAIVPTTFGGVQVEWHRNGIDLEIEIESTSRINVFYEDARSGVSWEDQLSANVEKLSSFVRMLSVP